MSAVFTGYDHITFDTTKDFGEVPIIKGTTMKVIELVIEQLAYGWSAEELRFQHPYLTLGKIYSALAYYWDHHATLDVEIEQRLKRVNVIQQSTNQPPLVARLRSQGLIQ